MIHPTIQAVVEKLKRGSYEYQESFGSVLAIVSLNNKMVYTVEHVSSIGKVCLHWKVLGQGSVEIPLFQDEERLLEVHARNLMKNGSARKYLDEPGYFNDPGYGG